MLKTVAYFIGMLIAFCGMSGCSDNSNTTSEKPDSTIVVDSTIQSKDSGTIEEAGDSTVSSPDVKQCGTQCMGEGQNVISRPFCKETGKTNLNEKFAWYHGCEPDNFVINPADGFIYYDNCSKCCAVCKDQRGYKGFFSSCTDELIFEEPLCTLE